MIDWLIDWLKCVENVVFLPSTTLETATLDRNPAKIRTHNTENRLLLYLLNMIIRLLTKKRGSIVEFVDTTTTTTLYVYTIYILCIWRGERRFLDFLSKKFTNTNASVFVIIAVATTTMIYTAWLCIFFFSRMNVSINQSISGDVWVNECPERRFRVNFLCVCAFFSGRKWPWLSNV